MLGLRLVSGYSRHYVAHHVCGQLQSGSAKTRKLPILGGVAMWSTHALMILVGSCKNT